MNVVESTHQIDYLAVTIIPRNGLKLSKKLYKPNNGWILNIHLTFSFVCVYEFIVFL